MITLEMRTPERFWSKVEKAESCWQWKSALNRQGYGVFSYNSQARLAHRVVWELIHGTIPKENVLHRCDNPSCVNPDHLYLGTQQDNVADMYRRNRENNIGAPKLTTSQILEIKVALVNGQKPVNLARLYNVTQQYISQLRTFTPRCWDG